ncbi:MAG: HAD-IA family hydrolase [Deltaproteobacteria bacterium]|nr:HAD-IA family hydrolase [Deltaproteobacteria bacterium]
MEEDVKVTSIKAIGIKAIGFDLFNTLITARPHAVSEAVERLFKSLKEQGFELQEDSFKQAYRENATRIIKETRKNGRETHNRFWISATLNSLGHDVEPYDQRIEACLDSYFSAFLDYCEVIPGTFEMLGTVRPFFQFVLISGALGYRKPHPFVFKRMREEFHVESENILYVGDDPDPDINGAVKAGMRAIWFTYARDHHIPTVPGVGPSGASEPVYDVPRASTWEEFLTIIGQGV